MRRLSLDDTAMPGRRQPKTLCLSVPAHQAGQALSRLSAAGWLDRRRAVTQRGQRVLLPLSQGAARQDDLGGELVEAELPPNPRLPPLERARWALEGTLPEPLLERLPTGWQVLGEVCLLRLDDALADHGPAIGRAYGQALGVASVLEIEESFGELRQPRTRLLWGQPDTRTVHREHGLVFHLDPAQVMFSPGNKTERHRLVDQVTPGEQVVDLFAGIGYFTLPLARAGARVVACEKNPVSAELLAENLVANDLTDRVEVRQGDCRQTAPEAVADRVMLGYFPGTQAFLECALGALKPEGGVLHYHTTAEEPDALDAAEAELRLALSSLTGRPRQARLRHARRVKSYAPGVAHVVLDLEVGPR